LNRGKESIHSFLVATAGADGTVKVWSCKNPADKEPWVCRATLDHSSFARVPANPDDEAEKPQVYALQWIDHWSGLPVATEKVTQNSFLLTSSDDLVHLWELEPTCEESNYLHFREVFSLHFTEFQNHHGYGVNMCSVTDSGLGLPNPNTVNGQQQGTGAVAGSPSGKGFGGERNPNNMIFVFDADYCAANGLLGVALADGSLRLCTGRGVCLSIMQLPGCRSHLTSFAWDATGTRLATCVATGHVIMWGVEVEVGQGALKTTCSAVLEGGRFVLGLCNTEHQ
jgi:WD40 repeat protein